MRQFKKMQDALASSIVLSAFFGMGAIVVSVSLWIMFGELVGSVAIMILTFFLVHSRIDITRTITFREMLMVAAAFISSFVLLVTLHNISSVATIAELFQLLTSSEFWLNILVLTALCSFLFLAIPILVWKMQRGRRHAWGFPTDAVRSGAYVYRKLAPTIASRTSEGELVHLLAIHNPVPTQVSEVTISAVNFYLGRLAHDSRLQKSDIERIVSLRDEYKRQEEIFLSPGYLPKNDSVPLEFQ